MRAIVIKQYGGPEVLAIEESGNQTLSSSEFTTE